VQKLRGDLCERAAFELGRGIHLDHLRRSNLAFETLQRGPGFWPTLWQIGAMEQHGFVRRTQHLKSAIRTSRLPPLTDDEWGAEKSILGRGDMIHIDSKRVLILAVIGIGGLNGGPQSALAEEADILDALSDEQAVSVGTGYEKPLNLAPAVATVSTAENTYGIKEAFPLNDVKRIEVLRGPASAVYGSDAAAGVINIVTKTVADIPHTEVGSRFGSFDTYDTWLLKRSRLGAFDLAVSLNGRTTAGYDAGIQADAQTALDRLFGTRASLAPGPINVGRNFIDARIDLSNDQWTFRAGYLTRFDVGSSVGASRALDLNSSADSGIVNMDLTRPWSISHAFDFSAQLTSVTTQTTFALSLFPPGVFNGEFPEGVRQALGVEENRVRAELVELYRGFTHHIVRFGLGGVHDWFDSTEDRRTYTVRSGLLFSTDAFAQQGGINDVTLFPTDTRGVFFAYGQDDWAFARNWTLSTGVRVDEYSDFGTSVNPRAGLVWNTRQDLTTKLLYGRAFRSPNFLELRSNGLLFGLGNPILGPSTLDTAEVAFNYRPTFIGAQTDLTFFWYTAHDIVAQIPNASSPNGFLFSNGASEEGYGFEIDNTWQIVPSLRLVARYAYQDVSDTTGNINTRLVPRHQVYGEADWQLAPQWHVTANVKSILERARPDSDPRPPISDYSLGLRRSSLLKHVDVAVYARNLLDEDAYEPSASATSSPFDLPLARRSIFGEIRLRF